MSSYSLLTNKFSKLFYSFAIAITVIVSIAIWKGISTFLFAWVLHFMLMMLVLAINETVMPQLTSPYFTIRPWEKNGRIYQWFGVDFYRKILVWIGWEQLNKKNNPVTKKTEALQRLEYITRQSEFGHLLIFLIVCLLSLFVIIQYDFQASAWLLGLNIPLHIYPILLQRYNRPRFQKTLKLLLEKANNIK